LCLGVHSVQTWGGVKEGTDIIRHLRYLNIFFHNVADSFVIVTGN
jgi:hypothetical protein